MPFLGGAFLAYIVFPLYKILTKYMPTILASLLAVSTFVLSFMVLFLWWMPLAIEEIGAFIEILPARFEELMIWLATLKQKYAMSFNFLSMDSLARIPWTHFWQGFEMVVSSVVGGGVAILNIFGFLFITPVLAFIILSDLALLQKWFSSWIPPYLQPAVFQAMATLDHAFAVTLRGYGLVILVMIFYYSFVFTLLDIPFSFALAVLNGVMILIPFIGVTVGFVASLMAVSFDMTMSLWLLLVFALGNGTESLYLTPRYVGGASGVHPLFFLFVVFFAGSVAGLMGAMLAAPLAAIMVAFMQLGAQLWKESPLYQKKKAS